MNIESYRENAYARASESSEKREKFEQINEELFEIKEALGPLKRKLRENEDSIEEKRIELSNKAREYSILEHLINFSDSDLKDLWKRYEKGKATVRYHDRKVAFTKEVFQKKNEELIVTASNAARKKSLLEFEIRALKQRIIDLENEITGLKIQIDKKTSRKIELKNGLQNLRAGITQSRGNANIKSSSIGDLSGIPESINPPRTAFAERVKQCMKEIRAANKIFASERIIEIRQEAKPRVKK